MTQELFAKFDKMYDLDGLKADITKAAENKTNFDEVPDGDYEVAITKMTLKESSNGNPMLSVWFKIIDGSYKNQIIFGNLMLTSAFGIHKVNEFLRGLGTGLNIEFNTFVEYNKLINEIFEHTKSYEYALEYTHNSKGYPEYKITDIFELN